MSDPRVNPRISPLIIRAKFRSGEKKCVGYVTNLSETGCFLATEELLSVDHTMRVALDSPWRLGQFEVEARVVWCNEAVGRQAENWPIGMGLAFVHLESEAKAKLREYIERFFELAAQLDPQGL